MRCRTNLWAILILVVALLLAAWGSLGLARHAISQRDDDDNDITTFPLPGGNAPAGLAFDGTFLFVADQTGFRTIFKLDPETGAVISSFLAPSPTGLDGRGNPNDMVSGGFKRLFVVDIGGNVPPGIVYEIDSGGTTILHSFSLPFRGGAIAFDGRRLYISDFDGSEVRVTKRSGQLIRTFDSKLRPAGMVFDPETRHLWVISELDRKISEITTEGQLIRSCDGPRDPGAQGNGAVTMVDEKLYIAEGSPLPPILPGRVFIVDPASLSCSPPID